MPLEISFLREKSMELKDKLMGFKDKVVHGFEFLDGIVEDVENAKPINKAALNASICEYMSNVKEKSEKIKENIEIVKGNLEGTPLAALFQKLEDKFEEYKAAFKPRWGAFLRALKDLEIGKEGALEAFQENIKKGKEECKDVLETVKAQAKEIVVKLMEFKMEGK